MPMIVICPVDGVENDGSERCRQCGADLGPLIRLSAIPVALLEEGRELLQAGCLDQAQERFATAVSLDGSSGEALAAMAEVYSHKEMFETAIQYLDRAADAGPDRDTLVATRESLRRKLEDRAAGENAHLKHTRRTAWRLKYWPPAAFVLGLLLFFSVMVAPKWFRHAPTTTETAALVRLRLSGNGETRGLNLAVEGSPEAVHVRGAVPSELHRQLVSALASSVAGSRLDLSGLKVQPPPPKPVFTYVVRPGDSFWAIALRKYHNPDFWREIEAANPSDRSPRRLNPGDRIILPSVAFQPR
jgi:nucleoid-associated protein YgaU